MRYNILETLILVTNSLIYKELTVEESTAVEFLNEKLLEAKKIYDQHRDKLIVSYGGKVNDKGVYEGIAKKTELAIKLMECQEMDIPFKSNTHILSLDSINTQTRIISLNGLQIRIMKEWMTKKEPIAPVLSDKYKGSGKSDTNRRRR